MEQPVTTSFNMKGQKPLDSKLTFKSLIDLKNSTTEDPNVFFSFYKGMKVYLQEEGEEIIWEEVNEVNVQNAILTEGFLYPLNLNYEGFDYSGKLFNFFYTNQIGNLKGNYFEEQRNTNTQNYI